MTDRTCETCTHSRNLFMADWKPPRHDLRCFRVGVLKDGTPDHHLNVGRSCRFETDGLPEPQRPVGQKCEKDRIHWEATQ